jgi:hypothetical protein
MREGDVYQWSYKDESGSSREYLYWCKDQQCVAIDRDGSIYLLDTYWSGIEPKFIGQNDHVVDPDKVELSFICNLNDVDFIHHYEVRDYDKVYNLSHQRNSYKVYAIDKGVEPSSNALITKYREDLEAAMSKKRCAEWDIERLNRDIAEILGSGAEK